MNIFESIILGVIQGIAEFLPISSSGHLVLFQKILKIPEPSMFFNVILHLGTLIPILIVYFKDILYLIKKPFQKTTYLLIVATLPAVVVALFFSDTIEYLFETGKFLSVGFFITGLVLLYADKPRQNTKKEVSYLDATLIGIAQSCAIFPAVSRSGSTISAALFLKINKEEAAKFSFLLSIPAILGATVLEIKDLITMPEVTNTPEFSIMFAGFVASIISGYLSINFLISIIKKAKLKYFSDYVFTVGSLVLIDQIFFGYIM